MAESDLSEEDLHSSFEKMYSEKLEKLNQVQRNWRN